MIIRFNFNDIDEIVKKYFSLRLKKYRVFTFRGPLGVGKTTLIRQLIKFLGVKGKITSPTFNYVNKYVVNEQKTIYHFDLYRLTSLDSFLSCGFDEYLYEDGLQKKICFVEWPEVIETLLQSDGLKNEVCTISMSFDDGNLDSRTITFSN